MSWASGFQAGSNMAKQWIDTYNQSVEAAKQKEIEALNKQYLEQSQQDAAAQSTPAAYGVDTGAINPNDLGAGGGTLTYTNAAARDAEAANQRSIANLQISPDAKPANQRDIDRLLAARDAESANQGFVADMKPSTNDNPSTETLLTNKGQGTQDKQQDVVTRGIPEVGGLVAKPLPPIADTQQANPGDQAPYKEVAASEPTTRKVGGVTKSDVINGYNAMIAAGDLKGASALRSGSGAVDGLNEWSKMPPAQARAFANPVASDPAISTPTVAPAASPLEALNTAPGLTPKAITTFDRPAVQVSPMDIYANKYVPMIQKQLMAQNKFKEADAFGQWAKDHKNQAYGEAWSKAAMLHSAGDDAGSANALVGLYNQMVPDGQYASIKPGSNGQYTVEVRRQSDNGLVSSNTGDLNKIVPMGIGMLTPSQQFESMYRMQEAANKTHMVPAGGTLVKEKSGETVYHSPSKEGTLSGDGKLVNEQQAYIVQRDRNPPGSPEWNRLNTIVGQYQNFIENAGKGVTVQNFTGANIPSTNPAAGQRTDWQVGKDGKVRPITVDDPGLKEKYLADQIKVAQGMFMSHAMTGARNGIDVTKAQRDIAQAVRDGAQPSEAVDRVVSHYKAYNTFLSNYKAETNPDKKMALYNEAAQQGIIVPMSEKNSAKYQQFSDDYKRNYNPLYETDEQKRLREEATRSGLISK